jgi:hypothetical protein
MNPREESPSRPVRLGGRPHLLGLALAVLVLLLTGCAGPAPAPTLTPASIPPTGPAPATPGAPRNETPAAPQQVRGMILEVAARNLTEVALLRLRDSQGREWSFTTQGPVGITPSHLREHQVFGQSVLVTYTEGPGQLVAQAVED